MNNPLICNDKHSKLNRTRVSGVEKPATEEEVITIMTGAARRGTKVSICGSRHAMGGQQFGTGTILVDLTSLKGLGPVNKEARWVEIGGGMTWPEIITGLHEQQADEEEVLSIRQKQTGADDLTIGGALAANIHGRGLSMKPIINDVEAFTLINANGRKLRCSRNENTEMFRLAIGGYGCFGIITSVQLRLSPKIKLKRVVEVATTAQAIEKLTERSRSGYLYGDFQFSIDESSADFLNKGILSCYRPVAHETPMPSSQKRLQASDWMDLITLAHLDRRTAFQKYTDFYLQSNGSLYWSDTHQLTVYLEDYHTQLDQDLGAKVPGSEMISELYVPREKLTVFMKRAAAFLKSDDVPLIYGTIRLIQKDDESFLPWAQEDYACVIFNLHTDHDGDGIARSAAAFRGLIDLATRLGGSYYLTYHRWARKDQILKAHPRMIDFLKEKRRHDPNGRFASNWWKHHDRLFESHLPRNGNPSPNSPTHPSDASLQAQHL